MSVKDYCQTKKLKVRKDNRNNKIVFEIKENQVTNQSNKQTKDTKEQRKY